MKHVVVFGFGIVALLGTAAVGQVAPPPATPGTGLNGAYFGQPAVGSNAAAQSYVNSHSAVATFTSTEVDYPAGIHDSTYSDTHTLAQFLGTDSATLSPALPGGNDLAGQLINFAGYINLPAGATTFEIGADDGALLDVNGTTLIDSGADHPFTVADATFTAPAAGLYPIELTYHEGQGNTGLSLRTVAGNVASVIPTMELYQTIPEPASLGLTALALLALRRRKA